MIITANWNKRQATDKPCRYCEIPAILKELTQATEGISFIGKKYHMENSREGFFLH